jgi:predicted nucleotide-binding protein (sugar kinase/HSP70/actin superfamily)
MLPIGTGSKDGGGGHPLKGKKVYIPPMAYGSGRAFAAVFRAIGVEADIVPPSDDRTRELGERYTSGDECYPAKVTVGDFMKLLERPDIDAARVVLFMPTAEGPCRFGQYAPYLRQLLQSNGHSRTEVISPTSENSYAGLGELSGPFVRTGWRALVSADILQKMLFQRRPYESTKGETEAAYERCLDDLCSTIENAPTTSAVQLKAIRESLVRCRDRFRRVRAQRDTATPVIGIVGEIFCRLNTFSNEDLVRRLEEYGGEAWMSDISEWVWYTNSEHFRVLRLKGQLFSKEGLKAWIRNRFQHHDEHVLLEPFREDFAGYEEPDIYEVLEYARPYLPRDGAMGEMVLNIGKAVYLAKKGIDGIIDISPFTCMNGIVCEAIYPRVSRDLGGIPIRNFYFDGAQSDLDRDLGVYLELVRSYQRRKKFQRAPQTAFA